MSKSGRPTKYRREFCQQLIDYMKQGHAFETFAVDLNVTVDTLYAWIHKYPEFSEARAKGVLAGQKTLETLGLMIAAGKVKGSGTSAWIFLCKNKLKWSDRVEVSGVQEKPLVLKYALDASPDQSKHQDRDGTDDHPREE